MKTSRSLMLLAGMASVLGMALAGVGRGQMRIGGAGESLRLSLLRLAPVRIEALLTRPRREAPRAGLNEPFDFSRLREPATSSTKGGPDR